MTETQFKDKVMKDLKTIPKSKFWKIQSVQIRGIPDILGVVNSMFIGIELKVARGGVTKLQQYNLDRIREAGGAAWIVYPHNWGYVRESLFRLSQSLI